MEFSLVLADKLFNVLEHSEPGSVLADVTFCVQHHTSQDLALKFTNIQIEVEILRVVGSLSWTGVWGFTDVADMGF